MAINWIISHINKCLFIYKIIFDYAWESCDRQNVGPEQTFSSLSFSLKSKPYVFSKKYLVKKFQVKK